ncbi:transposable element Tcb1 transposase [Trichonephila clavipes]|nr:transposable element Tcb1 transposase [Trichonephila clavipes]
MSDYFGQKLKMHFDNHYHCRQSDGGIRYYERCCKRWYREIGSRVGRNQTTLMWICDRWTQKGTTDRRGRSHPPHCTTSREDRQIVRIAETDRSATSRTVAQHIEFVTHHSVSARTIRHRLQQSGLSARRPLLGLPLTQNHRRLHRQWCDERRMFFVNHQIELLPWPARSPDLSPIENMWFMVAQRLTQITPPAAKPDQLWQRIESAWSAAPQDHIQSVFESMPRRVAAVISNNGGYSGY